MKKTINVKIIGLWREMLLAFGSALIGVIARFYLESYSAPFLQIKNIHIITYTFISILFLIVAIYIVSIGNYNIKRTEKINKQINDLTALLGVSVSYIPERKIATPKLIKLIADAKKELLVLDYNPLDDWDTKAKYSETEKAGKSRQEYYKAIEHKISNTSSLGFRYRRVLQVPRGYSVADIIVHDPVFRKHCEILVKQGFERPEFASLKSCIPIHEGNYILIDGKFLIIGINFTDPDYLFYTTRGYFFINDISGELINHFSKFFERADANATLVKLNELNKHPDPDHKNN